MEFLEPLVPNFYLIRPTESRFQDIPHFMIIIDWANQHAGNEMIDDKLNSNVQK